MSQSHVKTVWSPEYINQIPKYVNKVEQFSFSNIVKRYFTLTYVEIWSIIDVVIPSLRDFDFSLTSSNYFEIKNILWKDAKNMRKIMKFSIISRLLIIIKISFNFNYIKRILTKIPKNNRQLGKRNENCMLWPRFLYKLKLIYTDTQTHTHTYTPQL